MTIAFVFPGQGSQSAGMLDGFFRPQGESASAGVSAVDLEIQNAVQAVLDEADAALGENLSGLIAVGPIESLNLTTNTQPAMLVAGCAVLAAWRAVGGTEPVAVAGHSLGEYSALVAAGSLSLADAVRLVRIRARAMQDAVPVGTGAMAAILGLEDAAVLAVCAQASTDAKALGEPAVVEAVNFNAPSQVVIAGHREAVERACVLAKAAGAKRALSLPVSAPFHASLLEPAGRVLRSALAELELHEPRVPLVNNIDVVAESSPDRIRDALVRQAWGPVRWVEVILRLQAMGVTHVIECGPGKVLAGLTRRIAPELRSSSIYDAASLQAVLAEVAEVAERVGGAKAEGVTGVPS
jgi:[acyl-carrier-protein] S-malonyltransferase